MGNIHNLSADFIPIKYLHYMKDNIFVAKSGYLTLISEYGIVGFILFMLIIIKLISKLKRNMNLYNLNNILQYKKF